MICDEHEESAKWEVVGIAPVRGQWKVHKKDDEGEDE